MRKSHLVILAVLSVLIAGVAAAVWTGSRPSVGPCADGASAAGLKTYRAQTGDGNCLQGYVWEPANTPARGVLVVVHGLHDHAQRYAGLAGQLSAAGIAVLAQDHRGHAGSGGQRQRLDSIEQVMGDIDLALKEAAKRYPNTSLFLYGHSMGGLAVAHYATKPTSPLAGLVVSSGALKLPPDVNGVKVRIVQTLSALAPGMGLEAIDEANVVREAVARADLAADPLIVREKVPARTAATLLTGIAKIQEQMQEIKTPLLILHGQRDRVTEVDGSRDLLARVAVKDKSLKLYESALHDLLHEPEGKQVAQEILAFIDGRLPARK